MGQILVAFCGLEVVAPFPMALSGIELSDPPVEAVASSSRGRSPPGAGPFRSGTWGGVGPPSEGCAPDLAPGSIFWLEQRV